MSEGQRKERRNGIRLISIYGEKRSEELSDISAPAKEARARTVKVCPQSLQSSRPRWFFVSLQENERQLAKPGRNDKRRYAHLARYRPLMSTEDASEGLVCRVAAGTRESGRGEA